MRELVLKALEEARQAKLIGTSLEARVAHGRDELLKTTRQDLPALFIVSQVALDPGVTESHVERAEGAEVRALLEVFRAGRRGPGFPHGMRYCAP